MAVGKITEAVQDGEQIRVTVHVTEDPAGKQDHTAEVAIADLKALGTNAARKQTLLDAVIAKRTETIEKHTKVDAMLANLVGQEVTL